MLYDFSKHATFVGSPSGGFAAQVPKAIPGISFGKMESMPMDQNEHVILTAYRTPESLSGSAFADLFDLDVKTGYLAIAFVPFDSERLSHAKAYVEKALSSREARQTKSMLSDVFSKRTNNSVQTENFQDSEELALFTEVLTSINSSLLRNGKAYGVYFIVNDITGAVEKYIESRFLLLSRRKLKAEELFEGKKANEARSIPFGIDIASRFLVFRGAMDLGYVLNTVYPKSSGSIQVGTFMKGAVLETGDQVSISASSLNLGTIITGLPGSGKTKEAMSMIDSLCNGAKPKTFVISPTDEWDGFAQEHGMHLVRLFDGKTPINFFRCPKTANVQKFYEDLAMILSSASSAGPYRNPMEKCMLNAFRKVYADATAPDPVAVYDAIEESVCKFHAKKTNTGYKYTKHGENIRSALENLRAILNRPEYAAEEGIAIEELADRGAVFDLSNVSVSTKPYLYALILNQIYALASNFDTGGDGELRLLLCVEEAQMIFRDKDTAAVQDLKYRIQDFRKQGIGLMLLTHNVNDIEPSIRRLCQVKLYLKQAPDIAPVAARDLTFTYAKEEDVIQKLKHLDSRIGALNYVVKQGTDKVSQDTIFIKTKEYEGGAAAGAHQASAVQKKPPKMIDSKITLRLSGQEVKPRVAMLKIKYLGEEIASFEMGNIVSVTQRLIAGKKYVVELLDGRGRLIDSVDIIAVKNMTVEA